VPATVLSTLMSQQPYPVNTIFYHSPFTDDNVEPLCSKGALLALRPCSGQARLLCLVFLLSLEKQKQFSEVGGDAENGSGTG